LLEISSALKRQPTAVKARLTKFGLEYKGPVPAVESGPADYLPNATTTPGTDDSGATAASTEAQGEGGSSSS